VIDPKRASVRLSKTNVALAVVTAVLKLLDLLTWDAMAEAVRQAGGEYVEGNLQAVAAGKDLGDLVG